MVVKAYRYRNEKKHALEILFFLSKRLMKPCQGYTDEEIDMLDGRRWM